jgi:hypothetical protein
MKPLATALTLAVAALALVLMLPETSHAGGRHWGHHHRSWHGHHHGPGITFGFYYGYPRYYRPYPYYYYRPYPYAYAPPPVIYTPPPVQWVDPDRRAGVPPGSQDGGFDPSQCQMIREYQTQIMIDGKLVDAYGDACLMPDGSWRRGVPKVVPKQ